LDLIEEKLRDGYLEDLITLKATQIVDDKFEGCQPLASTSNEQLTELSQKLVVLE
jgi:hypothetical protein